MHSFKIEIPSLKLLNNHFPSEKSWINKTGNQYHERYSGDYCDWT